MKADTVSVCGQVRHGRRISFDADQWFTRYLNSPNPSTSSSEAATGASIPVARPSVQRKETSCSLLRCAAESTPSDKAAKSKDSDGSGAVREISFANTAQFLLLSLESVHALTQVRNTVLCFCFAFSLLFLRSFFFADDSGIE